MTKAPKRPRDLNQWAKRMVDIATGDVKDEILHHRDIEVAGGMK